MNIFERFQNRLNKSATLTPQPSEKVAIPVDQTQQQPPSQMDYSFPPNTQTLRGYTEPNTTEHYECAEEWAYPTGHSVRQNPSDTLTTQTETTNRSGRPVVGDAAYAVLKQTQRRAPSSQPHTRRAKTPLSSFYNVSSDDDDDDEEEEELEDEDPKADGEPTTGESAAAFERRSLRIRRSIDKAKAALPADFADRIGVAPELSDSVFRDRSGTRPSGMRLGNNEMDDTAVQPTGEEFNISDDEVDPTAQVPVADGDYANYPHPSPEHRKSTMHEESRDSYIEPDDRSASTSSSSKGPSTYMSQSGILWRSEHPQPLEELVARFRTNPPGSTYLTKAISQRSGCRCALCGHDSLLLFPVLDASLALASWASWSLPNKSHTRASSGYDRNGGMASAFATVSEIQAQLAVFRQCRGWYEVLNENQQAIPHLTTVEQFRRAKPSTFLIRRDLKCLAAPPTLLVPPLNDTRSTGDGAPPVPFPSSVVAIATASDTLMNSVQEIIPAGTLMHFVTYLPHCPVKRGRKIKELGLILATKRIPGSPIRRSRTGEMGNANNLPSRAYYIGLEDSTPAVFPSRFSISPVAGPENISGVHSLASVLRKFRLPISVRPVYAPEGGGSGGSSLLTSDQAERTSNGSYSRSSGMNPNPFQCGLSAVPGLQFSDRHYLRLLSLCRGDILIFAPISSPERLFLITPSMLRDHVFQLGSASDPAYEQLLEGHRMQSINFLASAHPRDSLNYLVRHMRDITREPRESYATRQTNRNKSDTIRGADSNNPPEMTQEELCQAYDELDDIYFFIRHGYYPPKNRRPETPIKTIEPTSTSRSAKNSISIPNQPGTYEQTETETMPRRPDAVSAVRTSVPTAEQLLAASLKTPVRNHSFQTRWTNGSGNVASTYRIQPKEYGI